MPIIEDNRVLTLMAQYAGSGQTGQISAVPVVELASAAISRLRRDMDKYKPDRPAVVYALAGETHATIMQEWRGHEHGIFTALLNALLDETLSVAKGLQAEAARIAPMNGYMYGLQDEAIRLEALLDILHEEILRIEAELRRHHARQPLQ